MDDNSPGATIANAQFPTLNSSTHQGMHFTGSALTQVIADDAVGADNSSVELSGHTDRRGDYAITRRVERVQLIFRAP